MVDALVRNQRYVPLIFVSNPLLTPTTDHGGCIGAKPAPKKIGSDLFSGTLNVSTILIQIASELFAIFPGRAPGPT